MVLTTISFGAHRKWCSYFGGTVVITYWSHLSYMEGKSFHVQYRNVMPQLAVFLIILYNTRYFSLEQGRRVCLASPFLLT